MTPVHCDQPGALPVAAALLIVPALVGLAWGRVRGRAAVGELAALGLAGAIATWLHPVVRVGDLAQLVLLAWVGVALGRRTGRRAVAQVLLALALADLGARAVLPPAPAFVDDPASPLLTHAPYRTHRARACALVHPDAPPPPAARGALPPIPEAGPVVLHLGDSLLDSIHPPGDLHLRAPERLDALDPTRAHVNLGVSRSSLPIQLAIAEAWLRAAPEVERVVVWAFLENDLDELGITLPCCDAVPDPPAAWCSAGSARPSRLAELLYTSGAPTVLRVASAWSPLAGHLRARLGALVPYAERPSPDRAAARVRYEAWLGRLAEVTEAAGTGALVVVQPFAPSRAEGFVEPRAWLAAAAARQGVALVDLADLHPWEAGDFDPPPDQFHFTPQGHAAAAAALAAWLDTHPVAR